MPSTPKWRKRAGKKGHSFVQQKMLGAENPSEVTVKVLHAGLREDGTNDFRRIHRFSSGTTRNDYEDEVTSPSISNKNVSSYEGKKIKKAETNIASNIKTKLGDETANSASPICDSRDNTLSKKCAIRETTRGGIQKYKEHETDDFVVKCGEGETLQYTNVLGNKNQENSNAETESGNDQHTAIQQAVQNPEREGTFVTSISYLDTVSSSSSTTNENVLKGCHEVTYTVKKWRPRSSFEIIPAPSPHSKLHNNQDKLPRSVSKEVSLDQEIINRTAAGLNLYRSKTLPEINLQSNKMSVSFTNSQPINHSRMGEKEDLQSLHDRFSTYIQMVQQLEGRTHKVDATSLHKSIKHLEDEMENVRTIYEKELDTLRRRIDDGNREKNHYKVQWEKVQEITTDLQNRLSIESTNNRRLMDDMNIVQCKNAQLERDLIDAQKIATQPLGEIDQLKRNLESLAQENHSLRQKYDKELMARQEFEDRILNLQNRLDFSGQISSQQLGELRQRMESSTSTILNLETQLRAATMNNDPSLHLIVQDIREKAEAELRKYQMESEQRFSKDVAALRSQLHEDNERIEGLLYERHTLQATISTLQAKLSSAEGKVVALEKHQDSLQSKLIDEQTRATENTRYLQKKVHKMQEVLLSRLQETSDSMETKVPLRTEIDALRVLLEEEEKRLQAPFLSISGLQYTTQSTHSPSDIITKHVTSNLNTANINRDMGPFPTQPTDAEIVSPYSTRQVHKDISRSAVTPNNSFPKEEIFETFKGTGYDYYNLDENNHSEDAFHYPLAKFDSEVGTTCQQNYAEINDDEKDVTYTYKTDPNTSYLQYHPYENMIPDTPRLLGPIPRAQSAPVGDPRYPAASSKLGKGHDYFDRMFNDVRKEVSFHPQPPTNRPSSGPPTSTYHDYNTATSSATGDLKIEEVNQQGKYVRLRNTGTKEVEFGGYTIQQNIGGHPVAVFRFPPKTKFAADTYITVWSSSGTDLLTHNPPEHWVWSEQKKWGTGPECTTILCKMNGQAVAWSTAAHRFARDPFRDQSAATTTSRQDYGSEYRASPMQPEIMTELDPSKMRNNNEPVYLKRDKQSPPSLSPTKHPHGLTPLTSSHPHMVAPRPVIEGNDNSSFVRQSRSQSHRPDPIPDKPCAGAPVQRIGSSPLRRYTPPNSSTVRGNGMVVNKQTGKIHYGLPSPFMSPLQQEYSQACSNRSTSLVSFTA